MKRLIAFIGIAGLLIGIRLYDDGIRRFADGRLTVYNNFDIEYVLDKELFLPTGADSYRIDLDKDTDIDEFLADCKATVVFVEGEENLIYAYSPLINRSVWVFNKRINIMIHKGNDSVNIGVPILKGSY